LQIVRDDPKVTARIEGRAEIHECGAVQRVLELIAAESTGGTAGGERHTDRRRARGADEPREVAPVVDAAGSGAKRERRPRLVRRDPVEGGAALVAAGVRLEGRGHGRRVRANRL